MIIDTQLPEIILSSEDFENLSEIVGGFRGDPDTVRGYLTRELDRADVRPSHEVPRNTVVMNSKVTFHDYTSSKTQTVVLVYPSDADIEKGRISVLTPVGAALLGLAEGQSIEWKSYAGEKRQLVVNSVNQSIVNSGVNSG